MIKTTIKFSDYFINDYEMEYREADLFFARLESLIEPSESSSKKVDPVDAFTGSGSTLQSPITVTPLHIAQ